MSIVSVCILVPLITLAAPSRPDHVQEMPLELAVGDSRITGSRIPEGRELFTVMIVRDEDSTAIGTLREDLDRVSSQARGQYIRRVLVLQAPPSGTSVDTVLVNAQTLAPVAFRSHNPQRTLRLEFDGSTVEGTITRPGEPTRSVRAVLDEPVFDANVIDLVLGSLPLRDGYSVRLPAYSQDSGGAIEVEAQVTGSETLVVDELRVDTWRVEGDVGGERLTWWFEKQTGAPVRRVVAAGADLRIAVIR